VLASILPSFDFARAAFTPPARPLLTPAPAQKIPPTLSYEIRCGTHRCGVSSTHGYECIHTIPYDGCNSHTVIYPPSERARISFVEITRNAAQFAIRNSRNSQFGEMQWQSCRQLSIEVAVWLVQGNGASAHMLLQCVAALQSYRGPHGGHLVAETR
jgi:hypothetical protein